MPITGLTLTQGINTNVGYIVAAWDPVVGQTYNFQWRRSGINAPWPEWVHDSSWMTERALIADLGASFDFRVRLYTEMDTWTSATWNPASTNPMATMTLASIFEYLSNEFYGGSTLTDGQKKQFTHWLNAAIADVWAVPEQAWNIFPWTAKSDTITLANYQFDRAADIDGSDVWTVWSEDPEMRFAAGRALGGTALPSTENGLGKITVQASSATADVVVYWRAPLPVYTWNGADPDPALPAALWPWVFADIAVRHAYANRASQTEGMKRRDDELIKLRDLADGTWRNAVWLNREATAQLIETQRYR